MDIIYKFRDLTRLPNMVGAIDGTHIHLFTRPQRGLTLMPCDLFNRKNFHIVFLEAVCNAEGFVWNVCAGQPGGVHDAAQFAWSKIYTQLRTREIIPKPILEIGGLEIQPYLLGDTAYLSRPYLLKSFKPNVNDPRFQNKRRFDESLNSGRVVIEKAFGALKNRWRILKNLNMELDGGATIALACCVLHNYCEIFSERVLLPNNFDQRANHFIGVRRGPLRVPGDGRAGKVAGKQMSAALFEARVAKNPFL